MSDTLPVAVTRMTFDDEFNSFTSSENGSVGWMTSLPYGGEAAYTLAGNNEAEFYGSSTIGENPFSLSSGVLSITATPANGTNAYGLPYNSGVITTADSFSQTYGYFEVNAKLPAGQGLWPAFWLLPASGAYTSELDVFEQLGANPSQIYATSHGSTNGSWSANSQMINVANTSTGFNTYGVDWEPTTTTFYMNGVAIASAPTPASMNNPMYMLLNLAVGGSGSWPGAASAGAFPATMQINYVRAYATAGTTYVGGTNAIPVGAATQTLVVNVSEDALGGDAQFEISVNGTLVSGVLSTQSLQSLGAVDSLTFNGTWSTGANTVSVTYLNAIVGSSTATSRSLYVDSITLDGVAAAGAPVKLTTDGTTSFVVPPAPTVIGSGPDTLALTISEDAYLGNAQFTVSVNGVQQGGIQTAQATNSAPYAPLLAQSQVFDIMGSFAASTDVVTVNFLNDLYGGSATADRNLYVLGAQLNGVAVVGSALNEVSAGPQSFSIIVAPPQAMIVAPPPPVIVTSPTVPAPTVIGSGPDTLALTISEDAYLGNAQFTVSINGVQQGGIQTALAADLTPYTPLLAQSQVFDINGSFASGTDVVTVNFLNDLYGGSATADRNLYVQGAQLNGVAVVGSALNEVSGGPQSFNIIVAATPPVIVTPLTTTSTTAPLQTPSLDTSPVVTPSALSLSLSEDAYLGDAMFIVSLDGTQLGAPQAVTALHDMGATQAFDFANIFSAGTHDLAISFLNDAYGGSPSLDRNLYIDSISVAGMTIPGASAALYSTGTTHFAIVVPPIV